MKKLSLDHLKNREKLLNLKLEEIKEEKKYLNYLIKNFHRFVQFEHKETINIEPDAPLKPLISEILKTYKRAMDWNEIARIIKEFKNEEVNPNSVRATLSSLVKLKKYKIVKEGKSKYKFEY